MRILRLDCSKSNRALLVVLPFRLTYEGPPASAVDIEAERNELRSGQLLFFHKKCFGLETIEIRMKNTRAEINSMNVLEA